MTAGTEERLETLEGNVKSLSELLKEKDGNKVMETRAIQEIETSVKQLKASFENGVKDVEVEEMELLAEERDQMDYSKKIPETACCENKLAADSTPSALEPNDSPVNQSRQKMQSKFKGKFPVRVLLGTMPAVNRRYCLLMRRPIYKLIVL